MMTRDEMARIAVRVLTERMAKQEIKERLRRQGVKLSYVPAREIIAQSKAWLREHPEIVVEGRARAEALGYPATQMTQNQSK
jgi:hypothetical protein